MKPKLCDQDNNVHRERSDGIERRPRSPEKAESQERDEGKDDS